MARAAAAGAPPASDPAFEAVTTAKPLDAVKPLERESEPEVEVVAPTRPYVVADLRVGELWAPLHETPPGTLAKWIGLVVEVESPIHLDEVMARVRTAAGVGRSGSRIREQMRLGAHG